MGKYDVLVLNSQYQPYAIWSWKKTMHKLYKDRDIEPVYSVTGQILKHDMLLRDGKGNQYDLPAVVVLRNIVGNNHDIATYSKRAVYYRDLGICQYCGVHVKPHSRTIDHVIPESKWDSSKYKFKCDSFENTVLACLRCNQKKADKTPKQAGMKLLKEPKKITRSRVYYNELAMREHIPTQWRNFIV
jgi:5-methylcytosine-specific restriction endonuclease McrA